ncbi:MAG: Lrp/AsnC family transcriptional regulator [Haloferacaceae archaeon]
MTDAFVHVHVDQGVAREAANEIATLDSVSAAHLVTGDYDIIVQIDLDDTDEIPDVVAREIHGVAGVLDTVTNVAFEP